MNRIPLMRLIIGIVLGSAFAALGWLGDKPREEHRLGEPQLADYCQLFANGGKLSGGAGGALGWRCLDFSDPVIGVTHGLFNLSTYCRDRYGQPSVAAITDLRRGDGWVCTTPSRARREFTVEIVIDAESPAVGERFRDQALIPIVDSPNAYLNASGAMNLRIRATVRSFCADVIEDEGGPPFMFGVITPTLQRGYVRSDFTVHPHDRRGLPDCQARPLQASTTNPTQLPKENTQ